MRLYALRHGETSWNVQRRFQGQSDIPLNDKGILLAELTGEGLANVPFDLAFTSPLCRARQTAELVLAGRDVPLYVEPRLIEMAFGVYEGVTANSGPGGTLNQNLVDFICHAERYQAPEGGETFQELSKRMADYLFDLCHRQELADKTILLASHGGAITALLNAIDPPEGFFWRGGVPYNCSYAIIDVGTDGVPVLVAENQNLLSLGTGTGQLPSVGLTARQRKNNSTTILWCCCFCVSLETALPFTKAESPIFSPLTSGCASRGLPAG